MRLEEGPGALDMKARAAPPTKKSLETFRFGHFSTMKCMAALGFNRMAENKLVSLMEASNSISESMSSI